MNDTSNLSTKLLTKSEFQEFESILHYFVNIYLSKLTEHYIYVFLDDKARNVVT